jgi:hypothetical protein
VLQPQRVKVFRVDILLRYRFHLVLAFCGERLYLFLDSYLWIFSIYCELNFWT